MHAPRKHGWSPLAAIAATAVVMTFASTPANAIHVDDIFQIDGDAFFATCGTAFPNASPPPSFLSCIGDDWSKLYSCPSTGALGTNCTKSIPGVGNGASAIADLVTDGTNVSIFTGGGSKDEKDVTQWKWTDGSVPDKDDLVQSFGALYTVQGGNILFFGSNRYAVNGNAQIGFWFLQNATFLCGDPKVTGPCAAGTFVAKNGQPVSHKIGDILILSNFVQGGGSSNIQVYKIVQTVGNTGFTPVPGTCPAGSVETSAGAGDLCLQQIVNGTAGANGVCNTQSVGGIPVDTACAATNGSVVPAIDPRFDPKTGGVANGNYPIVGFFEGGLDLGSIPELATECFPSYMVETRSSASITAVLKDFTLGRFQDCKSNIVTEIHLTSDPTGADIQCPAAPATCTPINSGTSIFDKGIVTGVVGAPKPTGTVTFSYFTDGACTAPAARTETVNLSGGVWDSTTNSIAVSSSSDTVVPTAASYQASYSGDALYPAGEDGCERIDVNKVTPTITTSATASVVVGTAIKDTATLSGGVGTPTGTISFSVYGPNDASCATALTPAPTSATVSGNGNYDSGNFTPTVAGTYRWRAFYSGDANNNAVSTPCNDTGETSVVTRATPTLTTTATAGPVVVGSTINDTAHLSGGYTTIGGTITFNVYAPGDTTCQTAIAVAPARTVTAAGDYTSGNYTTTSVGTYRWRAFYSGDTNNNAVSTACNDPDESSVVGSASPALTTNATVSVGVGGTIHDVAHLTGGVAPTGTITFNVYLPGDTTCATPVAVTPARTVSGNGDYTSADYTTAAAGTYRWRAFYSGDANNNAVSTPCNDANESSVVTKAQPSMGTAPQVTVVNNDSATLSGLFGAGTGTLTFTLYRGTIASPPDCTGTPVAGFPIVVTVAGNGTYSTNNTTPLTVSADTVFRWTVVYSGDGNNNGASSACTAEEVRIDVTP